MGQTFDWDMDYEAELRPRTIRVVPQPANPDAARSRRRGLPLAWLTPAVAIAGLGAFFWLSEDYRASQPSQVSVAAFGSGMVASAVPPMTPAVMELPFPPLQAYGPAQIDAFRGGIARFSADDLRLHAQRTGMQLGDGTGPLAPYLADTLALIQHEIALRGMVDTTSTRQAQQGRTGATDFDS